MFDFGDQSCRNETAQALIKFHEKLRKTALEGGWARPFCMRGVENLTNLAFYGLSTFTI